MRTFPPLNCLVELCKERGGGGADVEEEAGSVCCEDIKVVKGIMENLGKRRKIEERVRKIQMV